jgi:hypothetical protein
MVVLAIVDANGAPIFQDAAMLHDR